MSFSRRGFAVTAACLFVLACAPVCPAYAWWAAGHAAIAMMAYRQLKPASQTAVDTLLKAHPDYPNWLSELPVGTPEAKRGEYIFAIASTWPDRIKSAADATVSIKFFNPGDKRHPVPQPFPSDTAHYPELDQHSNWHYIDNPISADGKDHGTPSEESAMTAIPTCEGRIGAISLPASYRAYYLAWLIHIVGDLHQPLHAVGRYSSAYPNGDQGGNGVRLSAGGPNNLHSYWDSLLGDVPDKSNYNSLKGAWDGLNATINSITAESPGLLSGYDTASRDSRDQNRWMRESFAIAQETVYDIGPAGPDASGALPQPSAEYHQKALHIAHQRAALAARRLALVIEDALGEAQ